MSIIGFFILTLLNTLSSVTPEIVRHVAVYGDEIIGIFKQELGENISVVKHDADKKSVDGVYTLNNKDYNKDDEMFEAYYTVINNDTNVVDTYYVQVDLEGTITFEEFPPTQEE